MQIVIPILGLEENYYDRNLSNIQEILLYGLEKLDYVNYKRISFATFDHELMDMLHTVSDIFYQQKGVCIKANFEFNAITDPGLIRSQHEFASLGLGLITKLFFDYQKQYENPGADLFDLVCITGVLDKNPSRAAKIRGDFLSADTGKIGEKLVSFIGYVNRHNLTGKRCAFLYCGMDKEEVLREILQHHDLPHVTVRRFSNFNDLLLFITDNKAGQKRDNIQKKAGKKKKIFTFILFSIACIVVLCVILWIFFIRKGDSPKQYISSAKAEWAAAAIDKECRYIVDCSFTEYAHNNAICTSNNDIYGGLNLVRIPKEGSFWIGPRESAIGAVGLMQGAILLNARGYDTTVYDQVLHKFFWDWATGKVRSIGRCRVREDRDYGAWADGIHYSESGQYQRIDGWNTGVTAYMLIAMWQYYEYSVGTGQGGEDWLHHAWPDILAGAGFLCRMYNPHYKLVQPHKAWTGMFTVDSALASVAMKCAARWQELIKDNTVSQAENYSYVTYAENLKQGISAMIDTGSWKNFLTLRNDDGRKEYACCIDHNCLAPYEIDALDPQDLDDYAREISDWWTDPGAECDFRMTSRINDPADWRYWGVHEKHFKNNPEESNYLFPGIGLQLAKVEWKYGKAAGKSTYLERAARRLEWVYNPAYSNLWYGANGRSDQGVSNGILNWRNAILYQNTAQVWERLISTSSYFIQVCGMVFFDTDTKLTPGM